MGEQSMQNPMLSCCLVRWLTSCRIAYGARILTFVFTSFQCLLMRVLMTPKQGGIRKPFDKCCQDLPRQRYYRNRPYLVSMPSYTSVPKLERTSKGHGYFAVAQARCMSERMWKGRLLVNLALSTWCLIPSLPDHQLGKHIVYRAVQSVRTNLPP